MTPPNIIRVLCVGDVVGRPGRTVLSKKLKQLREELKIDCAIVNGENSAGGAGIELSTAYEIRDAGADLITLGDHTYQRKESEALLNKHSDWCIRPANYSAGAPGRGWAILTIKQVKIGVMNLMGRTFISIPLDCPFQAAERILKQDLPDCTVRVCDMHAEATSEKIAMGRFLDGRLSLQFGTHTHVATADEQILPAGTGYISDVGMTGSQDGVIGMDADVALARFLTGRPHPYKIAEGAGVISAIVAEIDATSGKALSVKRVISKDDES